METLIGLKQPETKNIHTNSKKDLAKKRQVLDFLTEMEEEVSVFFAEKEQKGLEVNLLTGEYQQPTHLAAADAPEAMTSNEGDKGTQMEDMQDGRTSFNMDEHSGTREPLYADIAEETTHTLNPDLVHPDEHNQDFGAYGHSENGDCLGEEASKSELNDPIKNAHVPEEEDLIDFDDHFPPLGPQNPLYEQHNYPAECNTANLLDSSPFPPPATSSGPSFIRPGEIKSAYGLNRKREYLAARHARDEDVLKALEYFKEKLRREAAEKIVKR